MLERPSRLTRGLAAALFVLAAACQADPGTGAANKAAAGPPTGPNAEVAQASGRTPPAGLHPAAAAGPTPASGMGDGAAAPVSGGSAGGATSSGTGAGAEGPASPPPAPGQKSKQRVTFTGSRGDKVPGYLWLPAHAPGQKVPAAILMYGLGGNKDDGNIARVGDLLSSAGIASLTLDWPGTGDRGKIASADRIINPDIKEWTVGDYGSALSFLVAQPDIDANRLAYVGASMGAMTGIAFAAREPRIKAIVAVVPIPNPLWGGDDPSVRIAQLAPRPLLCIATADNSDFSGEVCARVGQGGQTKALPGGHELQGYREEVVTEASAFLEQALK